MRHSHPIAVVLLVLALTACATTSPAGKEAKKVLVRRFTNALNAADWDALDDLLTEDFRRHSQATPGPPVNSREEFKKLQQSFYESMPDQTVAIRMLVAEGDKVAALARYTGTQTGPMAGYPITGKPVQIEFLSIFRIQNGRIAELWVEWDNLSMLEQLGLFPPAKPPQD